LENATTASAELVAPNGTVQQVGSATAPEGETLKDLQLDAQGVPSGLYLLRLNGLDSSGSNFNLAQNVYIDADLPARGVFSIIELFYDPDELLGEFHLYDEDNGFTLREREFIVQFLNRHTFWRYHFSDPPDTSGSATDLGDLEPINDHIDQFVTKHVKPLTRGVESVNFAGDTLLPNPPAGPIVPEADRVYSDIYIHTK